MIDPSGSIWLAATAFDQPARLGDALVDLQAHDIGPPVICLLGQHTAVEGMRDVVCGGKADRGAFLPLFHDLVRVPFPIGGAPVFATAGRLLTNVKNAPQAMRRGNDASDGTLHGCWLPGAQRERLASAIARGSVVLLANPANRTHWTDSTKVLLRHSRHPVQSHEFSRAHIDGQ